MSTGGAIGMAIGAAEGAHLASGTPDTLIIDIPLIIGGALIGAAIGDSVGGFMARESRRREEEAKYGFCEI